MNNVFRLLLHYILFVFTSIITYNAFQYKLSDLTVSKILLLDF